MSDFLDNLTDRLSDQELAGLQPRLASRFEQSALANHETMTDGDSRADDEPQTLQFARILPSESRNEVAQPQLKPSSMEAAIVPKVVAPIGPELLQQTEAVTQPRPTVSIPSTDFADRLNQISESVERLSGLIPESSNPAAPEIQALKQPSGPSSHVDPNPAIVSARSEHHHIRHEVDVQQLPLDPEEGRPAPVEPPSIAVETKHAPDRIENAHAAGEAIVSETPQLQTRALPVEIPQIPTVSEQQAAIPVESQEQGSVPKIVVESIAAARSIEKTVNVTIGRIDVRAVPKAEPSKTAVRRQTSRSITPLEDYLQRRSGGRR